MPAWIPPMLATLTDELPTRGNWVYEPKLDGVRALI
jgi:ATP-dependent DNA ligase